MADEKTIEEQLKSIQLETQQVQLETAKIQLEQSRAQNAVYRATQEQRSRQNKQRQTQLRRDVNEKARLSRQCSHRQGGSVGGKAWGKGQSALTISIMPDESKLIMCSICPLRVFSPDMRNKSVRPREGETTAEAKARAAKYRQDLKEFEELEELAMDKLTPEAAAPMHCGVTFKYQDGEGRDCLTPRPCDGYLQGTDTRVGIETV